MIDFSGKTRERIQDDLLSRVPDNLDKRQGSIIQTAIGPSAWYLEGLYLEMDKVQKNAYAETANGKSLDLLAMNRNLKRKAAVPAVREGTFNIEIPAGSKFKTINGTNSVIFTSGELVSADEGEYVYLMQCETAGEIGNSYTGPIMPVTAIVGLTSASIGKIKVIGTEEEIDVSLRTRYFASFDVANFGGNIAAYRNTILAIDGVGAVQVYPAWKGGGTVLCSILGDDLKPALPALVEQVQEIICPAEEGQEAPSANGYGMAPIGAAVTVTTAEECILNVSCNIQFAATIQDGEERFHEEVEAKIEEYLKEVSTSWGNALRSHVIQYSVTVYLSRIIYSILQIPEIINVTNVLVNGSGNDITLTETAVLQQVPVLGTVVINGA